MTPEELIDIRKKPDENIHQFHAKGLLLTGDQNYDKSFVDAIRVSHRDGLAISRVTYPDKCSVSVMLHYGFVGDWAEVEQAVLGLICGRLRWDGKVTIRRHDADGKLEGPDEYFQLATDASSAERIEEFFTTALKSANNVPPKE